MKDDQGDQDLCDGSAYRQTSNDQTEDSRIQDDQGDQDLGDGSTYLKTKNYQDDGLVKVYLTS